MKGPEASLCVCVCVCVRPRSFYLYLLVWLMCWNPAEVNSTFYLLLAATARFPRWVGRNRTGAVQRATHRDKQIWLSPRNTPRHTHTHTHTHTPRHTHTHTHTHPDTHTHTHTHTHTVQDIVRASNYNPSASCSNAPEAWHWENLSKPVAHNPKKMDRRPAGLFLQVKNAKKINKGILAGTKKNVWCKNVFLHL